MSLRPAPVARRDPRSGPVVVRAPFRRRSRFARVLAGWTWRYDASFKVRWIRPHRLRVGDRVLDVGAGPGAVGARLHADGFAVTGLDVVDWTVPSMSRPIPFDGARMPVRTDAFDVVLLLTVLHHAEDAAAVLAEAARVAPRVIVIEDVVRSESEKRWVGLIDRCVNLEIGGPPPCHLRDDEWRGLFATSGLSPLDVETRRRAGPFFQRLYSLTRGPVARITSTS